MASSSEKPSESGVLSGIEKVRMLYGPEDWTQWDKSIRIYLKINGLIDLLNKTKDRPEKLPDKREIEHQ